MLSIKAPACLARCSVDNHPSGLDSGEIFIAEPYANNNALFKGKSLTGYPINSDLTSNDFSKLDLPSGTWAMSVCEYESPESDHLSFMKFTLLRIEENKDGWIKGSIALDSGKLLGMSGLFPSHAIALLPSVQLSTTRATVVADFEPKVPGELKLTAGELVQIVDSSAGDSWQVKNSTGSIGICPKTFLRLADTESVLPSQSMLEPYGTALYDFTSEYDQELSFLSGDVIKLFRWVNSEWLSGKNERTGSTGIVPAGFIQIVIAPTTLNPQVTGESMTRFDEHAIGYGTMLFTFEARYADELSIEAGASVKILEFKDQWVRCYDPETGQTGIVPLDFVRMFLDDEEQEYDSKRTSIAPQTPQSEERPWGSLDVAPLMTKSASMSSLPQRKTPPARPPPPRVSPFPLLSKEPSTENEGGSSSSSAVRKPLPVQRMAPERPKSTVLRSSFDRDSSPDDWAQQRMKVIDEVIQSEAAYLFDLTVWESAVENNQNIAAARKKLILNGYNMLKYLSRELTANLMAEVQKPAIDQEIGLRFMQLKEMFYKTFGQYFRSAEQISDIILKGSEETQRALQSSLEEMRQRGSNIFDVSTALSRPIQRCLKYPLYIGELCKYTPLTHPDHPKLLEALKQMSHLATKMNESKRRKELARKYTKIAMEQQNTSFFSRLSKLNMRSVQKKSSRLQYRIGVSMGWAQKYEDSEFDSLVKKLGELQQHYCRLIYQLTVYKNRIIRLSKKFVDFHTMAPLPKGFDRMNRFEYCILLRRLIVFVQELDVDMTELIRSAQEQAKKDHTFLIQKRCDKLADFEMATRKKKPSDVVSMRKCEFEAMNSQLKIILPKDIELLSNALIDCVNRIRQIDGAFFSRVQSWMQELPYAGHPSLMNFVDPRQNRLQRIEDTLKLRSGQITKSTTQPPPNEPFMPFNRSQTDDERLQLIRKCRSMGTDENLFEVVKDYYTRGGKCVLRKGDYVCEKKCKDGMRTVDTGVSTFTVDENYFERADPQVVELLVATAEAARPPVVKQVIQYVSEQPVSKSSNTNKQQFVIPTEYRQRLSEKPPPAPDSLMLLEPSSSSSASSSAVNNRQSWITFEHETPLTLPSSTLPSIVNDLASTGNNLTFPENCPPLMPTKSLIIPTPTAPPPVLPPRSAIYTPPATLPPAPSQQLPPRKPVYQKPAYDPLDDLVKMEIEKTRNYSKLPSQALLTNNSTPHSSHNNDIPQPKYETPISDNDIPTYAIAQYPFEPDNMLQLRIMEGDRLRVLRQCDDAHNPEWWLVQTQAGKNGYVPSTYISIQQ